MILRSIQVQGWRCFADPVAVGPFGNGINVVHAPNASGKSTLLGALLRGFFDTHRVGGKDVETLRPWGRDLAPEVTLEFSEQGTVYRLRKRFLDSPSSELLRQEGNRFARLAEGDKADEAARGFFAGTSPGRGLSKPGHWGLAQVLLTPQGQMEVPELSGNLVADIQRSLGAQTSGPGAGPLEQKIEAAYLRFFTPTGKLKTGKDAPRAVELRVRRDELEQRRHGLLQDLEAFEEASRRVEDLRARRSQARHQQENLEEELARARRQAQDYARLANERELKRGEAQTAEARHEELKQRVEGIARSRQELAGIREEIGRLGTALALGSREVRALAESAENAKAGLDEVRKGRSGVEAAEKEAEDALRYVQARQSLAGLQALLQRVRETERELETRRKELAAAVAPDAKALNAIRRALKARDDAQVRLDAALITLEIVPRTPGRLEVLAAEQTGWRQLEPGAPITVKGAPEVVVELEGVARVRARGPAGTVEELRGELGRATRKLESLTAGFGTVEIDQLEALSEQARGIEQNLAGAQMRLETLLSGRAVEEIEQEREKQQRVLEEIGRDFPEWAETPPEADSLRDGARRVRQTFIARVEGAELEREKAEQALQAANLKLTGLQARHDTSDRQAQSVAHQLEQMQRDGLDEEKRAERLRQIALQWAAASGLLAEADRELERFPQDPRPLVETLERQLKALGEQAASALEAQKLEEGRLQQLAAAGPYSALCRLEETLAELEAQIQAEELRIEATRLLRDTVAGCRSAALAGIRKPVEEAATRTLQRIAGSRLGGVQLAESFRPQGVTPRLAGTEVDLPDLSGGEKEQVHLAVRLALAEVLAGNDRRFLVLDDILTATDTGRLARVLAILEEAARSLQILVFTCHPERYRGLAAADFFDLEGITGRA